MQPSVREELYALREMVTQFLRKLERLEQMLQPQVKESFNMELTPEEEFRQKFPNLPVPTGLLKLAGTMSPNSPKDDWKVIADVVASRYKQRRAKDID
ncbi:hypothetical protein FJZ31_10385 [Candidatus Poribacteria bacterium]|nr:hypothetical protein [Candidatus Poribacteria bacterium]